MEFATHCNSLHQTQLLYMGTRRGMLTSETIRQVRKHTNLAEVVRGHVPTLAQDGRSLVGPCPFHAGQAQSFRVNTDRDFYHCFGCNESGSAIEFVMKIKKLGFDSAVRWLAKRAGVEVHTEESSSVAI